MVADIAGADPKLAARMHLALGGLYLDRLRVDDAIRELAAARAADPLVRRCRSSSGSCTRRSPATGPRQLRP